MVSFVNFSGSHDYETKAASEECKIQSAFTVIFGQIFPISLTICILGRSVY